MKEVMVSISLKDLEALARGRDRLFGCGYGDESAVTGGIQAMDRILASARVLILGKLSPRYNDTAAKKGEQNVQ